jgi:heat shock protein beta
MIRKLAEDEVEDDEGEEDEDESYEQDEETTKSKLEKEDTDEDDDEENETPNESKYEKFWKAFGKNIKLGVIEDQGNRSKLAKLLRFKSTKSDNVFTSLDEYIARMISGQDSIYFLPGDSEESILKSPLLQKFK